MSLRRSLPRIDQNGSRRRFLTYLSTLGFSRTVPDVLSAYCQQRLPRQITAAMVEDALAVAGLEFTAEQRLEILSGLNEQLVRYDQLRALRVGDDIAPPVYFNPLVPGMRPDRVRR